MDNRAMNVFGIVRVMKTSIDGHIPESPLFSKQPMSAKAGDILVVDGKSSGRAGGAVRPETINWHDENLHPMPREYLRRLGHLRM